MMPDLLEPIAIIGSACRFPGSVDTPSKLWELLSKPRDVGSRLPSARFDPDSFYHVDSQHHGHANVKDFRSYFLDSGAERRFDAAFFGINPAEANVLDPQVRLLLETTYEALEEAGQTMDMLQGSDTGCYVGLMLGEYEQFMSRDPESIGTYHVLGTARSLVSNRLSYFFDWHGPSMTIDTACSSSLVAIHQAVQLLRSSPTTPSSEGSEGRSRVAVAAGTNLILDPMTYVSESKLQMLSPDGQGRMWDAAANGYARGEGVATVVLKRLCDAIADGDHVECIIRETGVNSDGKTRGITMPSASAQATLIRDTYRRAGLVLSNARDRPQLFEAHGTGTPAGDPVEAEAIYEAFYKDNGDDVAESHVDESSDKLLVGSIKTVLGHAEGAAGIAAILKASLALQHAAVPPNMLFKSLNPRIKPFSARLRVPASASAEPWPTIPAEQPRRASVNNFGFGGTNAHVILESSADTSRTTQSSGVFTPFVFSAATETSLRKYLERFLAYIEDNLDHVDAHLHDLAYTLHTRRSRLPYATSVAASSANDLCAKLKEKLQASSSQGDSQQAPLGVRLPSTTDDSPPVILGVFTGQGAQWPRMGAELLLSSPAAAAIIAKLEARLARLPVPDRPAWSIREELLRDSSSSRIGEASLSQPLCTVVQVVLVDLLRAAGIRFAAVVGHSSGEIAAAYAAGIISAEDAVCIAYYRGLHVERLRGARRGAMMAVGGTAEDAAELVDSHVFAGRAAIAAYNSSDSLTLSGDEDAIEELKIIFEDEGTFARVLRVDQAYHSHHMAPMSAGYLESLRALDINVSEPSIPWISSVHGRSVTGGKSDDLAQVKGEYWVDNALRPVLFMQAVQGACDHLSSISGGSSRVMDLAIELGPHPALKAPALKTIKESSGQQQDVPYTGLLKRGTPDVVSLAEGLGYAWTHLSRHSLHLDTFDKFSRTELSTPRVVKNLPRYAWDHDAAYWHESRHGRATMTRGREHPLLGHLSSEVNPAEQELRWRQLLSPAELPWMDGHRLQDQAVFPAAGYVVLAIEACRELVHRLNSKSGVDAISATLIQVFDVEIHKAMTFDSVDARVEANFSLQSIVTEQDEGAVSAISASFTYSAAPVGTTQKAQSDAPLRLLANGRVKIDIGPVGTDHPPALPARGPRPEETLPVKAEDFYESLQRLEYSYLGPFRALNGLQRKLGHVNGWVSTPEALADQAGKSIEDRRGGEGLLVHPAMLDAAFQAVLLAKSAPFDGSLWSMHVPRRIARISVDPALCKAVAVAGEKKLPLDAWQPEDATTSTFMGDVDVYPPVSDEQQLEQHAMIQVEGLECVPFSSATEAQDKEHLSVLHWGLATPDAHQAAVDSGLGAKDPQAEVELAQYLERLGHFYLQKLQRDVPATALCRKAGQPLSRLFDYAEYVEQRVSSGALGFWRDEWRADTLEELRRVGELHGHWSTVDARLLSRIGDNMVDITSGKTTAIEVAMGSDRLLHQYYPAALGMSHNTRYLAATVAQIVHRHPRCRMLEIGAGTGGATKAVLGLIGNTFESYTFTDVSSGFFPTAQEVFADRPWADKMIYKVLDITSDPLAQPGFDGKADDAGADDGKYDVIIASMVLHATPSLNVSLANTRRLLRPGGWLIVNEGVSNDLARVGAIFGAFPGWWLGAETDGRVLGPHLPIEGWDQVLRDVGFSGVDSSAPIPDDLLTCNTIFASQAMDQKMAFLREPLSTETTLAKLLPSKKELRELVILGGRSNATAGVTEELETIFRKQDYFSSVQRLDTLAELSVLSASTTVLSLVDIDEPVFEELGQTNFDAMKTLLITAGRVLWVTQGRRHAKPFANMTVGLLRSVLLEIPDLSCQFLDYEDVDGPLDARAIAESLLRYEAGLAWTSEGQPRMLTTTELELVVGGHGEVLIPRFISDKAMNDRHNSARRPIYRILATERDAGESNKIVRVKRDERSGTLFLDHDENDVDKQDTEVCLQTTHSLFASIQTSKENGAQSHLSLVRDASVGSLHVALSRDIASSTQAVHGLVPVSCHEHSVLPDTESKARFLRMVALNLLSGGIINHYQSWKPDQHLNLVLFEPEPALGALLKREAAAARSNIKVKIASSSMSRSRCELLAWSHIHPKAPRRAIRELLALPPDQTSVLLVFSDAAAAARIIAHAPPGCKVVPDPVADLGLLAGNELDVRDALKAAVLGAQKDVSSLSLDTHIIPASQLDQPSAQHDWNGQNADKVVIDWEQHQQPALPLRIRPIDDPQNLSFTGSRTYWLAGLSGGLGLSLAEWMAAHGARHFLITSRRPRIPYSWVARMASRYGAVVRVHANDLTDWADTSRLYHDVCASGMPPVGGVAMGAMVLADTSLGNMSLKEMRKVCEPKVQGSINLNRLFSGNHGDKGLDLDFFVFFSSLTAATGNPGQSNYSAANLFMTSLAEQRRRKGLAASVIHIGVILGVGYVQEKTDASKTNFNRTSGYSFSAEHDFLQQFAEAVVAGREARAKNNQRAPLEIALGLHHVSDQPEKRPFWFDNATMSHFIRSSGASKATQGGSTANQQKSVPLKTLLAAATTREQLTDILTDAFLPFVCSLFQLSAPTGADEQQQKLEMKELLLDRIGLDSLLAVEIRLWWLKIVQVNMPVMKILTSLTVGNLISAGVDGLPLPSSDSELDSVEPASSSDEGDRGATQTPSSSEGTVGTPPIFSSSTDLSDVTRIDSPKLTMPSSHISPTRSTPPHPITKWMDLSFSQSMFWSVLSFVEDHEEGDVDRQSNSSRLNHTGLFRLTGPVNIPALERALELLGDRHEALRTCFQSDDDTGTTKQAIMSHSTLRLERRAIPDEAAARQTADDLQNHYKFNFAAGECLRAILLELPKGSTPPSSAGCSFLVYCTHSLALDGVSASVFTRELQHLYGAMLDDGSGNKSALEPLSDSAQYSTFANAQLADYAAGHFESSLKIFRAKLAAQPSRLTQALSVLRVGDDSAITRPQQISYENHHASVTIGADIKEKLWQVCREHKARPFHFFLAAFRVLLARLSTDAADEVSIGIGDANRSWHEDALNSLGPYINLLPLWFKNAADAKFGQILADTRATADEMLALSSVPFQVLLNELDFARSTAHTPIFQAFFDYRQGMRKAKQPFGSDGTEVEFVTFLPPGVPYDVSIDIIDDGGAGECHVSVIVRADMYSARDAEVMARCYEKLVRAFATNGGSDLTVVEPEIFDQSSVERALAFGRGSGYVPSKWSRAESESIIGRLNVVAKEHPEGVALRLARAGQDGGLPTVGTEAALACMTYNQMLEKAQAIAAAVQAAAASHRVDSAKLVVAVYQEPTPDWLCSVLGVFMAGAVCVPCDASTPLKRLVDIIDDSKASVLIVDRYADIRAVEELSSRGGRTAILVDRCTGALSQAATVGPEDAAMILYTSGSTGKPKGIVLSHGGLTNWAEHVPPMFMRSKQLNNTTETVLQQSSCGFDMSYLQSFFALAHGGTVCIVPRALRADAVAITEIMAAEGVTVTQGVPSEYTNWLRYGDQQSLLTALRTWTTAMCGGEPGTNLVRDLIHKLSLESSAGGARPQLYHMYGPTETTFIAAAMELAYDSLTEDASPRNLPLGTPLPNYALYVLDEGGRAVPPGVQGEIYIGGAGVGAGYLNREELTTETFVADPFAPVAGFDKQPGWNTMHRTGDNGRWRADGVLLIEGRRAGDTQHKLRGLRVDLQEVETVLLRESGGRLSEAVVSVRRRSAEAPEFLVAHVRLDPSWKKPEDDDKGEWLHRLAVTLPLPRYMLPSATVVVSQLPSTSSGKLDRRAVAALPLPDDVQAAAEAAVVVGDEEQEDGRDAEMDGDLNETEQLLRQMWEDVIFKNIVTPPRRISRYTNIFHVGGSSLLLPQLQAQIRTGFGVRVPLTQLVKASTLGGMAGVIDNFVAKKKGRVAPTVSAS